MEKRGQAAMEFLMTYGWAILAVLISIAALAFFGVLNPSRFLPESCTIFPGIACTDFSITNAEVTLVLQNGLGQTLNPLSITIPGCGSEGLVNGLQEGSKATLVIPCIAPLQTNSRFKGDMAVSYSLSSISHNRTGTILSRVANNYVRNAGFELNDSRLDISQVDYWLCTPEGTTNTYIVTNIDAATGRYSLKHSSSVASEICLSNYLTGTEYIPIDPTRSYTLCVSHKALAGPAVSATALSIYPYNSVGGTFAGEPQFQASATASTTSWQRLCGTRSSFPAGTTQVRALIVAQASPTGGTVLIDDVSIT